MAGPKAEKVEATKLNNELFCRAARQDISGGTWFLSVIHFFVSFLMTFFPRVSAIIKNRFLEQWLISRLALCGFPAKKKKEKEKENQRAHGKPRRSSKQKAMRIPINLMTANVDEDDCNKCRWFTWSLDKGYHRTELMVYARQHAADISDSAGLQSKH